MLVRACLCMERGQTSRPRLKKTRAIIRRVFFIRRCLAGFSVYERREKLLFIREHLSFWTQDVSLPHPVPLLPTVPFRSRRKPARNLQETCRDRRPIGLMLNGFGRRDAVTTCVKCVVIISRDNFDDSTLILGEKRATRTTRQNNARFLFSLSQGKIRNKTEEKRYRGAI